MNKQGIDRILMTSLGLIALVGPALVEAGQWVVIAAEQSTLQPGTLVPGDKPLKLAEGAQLVLLAEDGKTLKLTGPYSGVPSGRSKGGGESSNLNAIANLLQGHQQATSTLGVMRGASVVEPLTADLINVDSSGERCLTSDPVVLWRSNTTALEPVTLADANGSRLASFTWPAGVARLSTPSRYFEDGKSYLLQRPGKSVSLRVHKGAPSPANSAALVGWMAKSGCKAQALSVLAKLAEE